MALCQWVLDAIIQAQIVAVAKVEEGALAAEAVDLAEAELVAAGKICLL